MLTFNLVQKYKQRLWYRLDLWVDFVVGCFHSFVLRVTPLFLGCPGLIQRNEVSNKILIYPLYSFSTAINAMGSQNTQVHYVKKICFDVDILLEVIVGQKTVSATDSEESTIVL